MDLLDWGVDQGVEGGQSPNRVRGLGLGRRLVRLSYIDVDVYCYARCTAFLNVTKYHHFVVVGCGAIVVENDLCQCGTRTWVYDSLPSSVARPELQAFRDA